jgi:hypothetical protein
MATCPNPHTLLFPLAVFNKETIGTVALGVNSRKRLPIQISIVVTIEVKSAHIKKILITISFEIFF